MLCCFCFCWIFNMLQSSMGSVFMVKKKYCAGPSNLGILKSLHTLISGPTSFLVFLLYKDFNLTEADCFSLQGCFSDCSDVSPASAEAESSWIRAAPLGVFLQSAERWAEPHIETDRLQLITRLLQFNESTRSTRQAWPRRPSLPSSQPDCRWYLPESRLNTGRS